MHLSRWISAVSLVIICSAVVPGGAEPLNVTNRTGIDGDWMLRVEQPPSKPGGEVPDEVEALRSRIIELQNKGKLGFRKIVSCRSIEGFGMYSPLEPGEQVPKLLLYCEPSNVSTMVSEGRYVVDCSVDVALVDVQNRPVLGKQDVIKINRVSRSPVLDLYFRIGINLQKLGNRDLTARIVLHDKIKNQSITGEYKIGSEHGGKKIDFRTGGNRTHDI